MKANPKHIVQASGHGWPRAKDVFPRRFKRPHELCSHFLCVHVVTPPGTDNKKNDRNFRAYTKRQKIPNWFCFYFIFGFFFFLPLLFLRLSASIVCDSTRKKKSARWTLPPLVHLCILYIDLSAKALVVKEMAHLKNSTLAYREKPIRSVLAIGGLAATSCLNDFSQNLVGLFYMNWNGHFTFFFFLFSVK